ncbi:MAG: lysophospholipid acyltransferase family protein [Planctomycetaceae bacterium]
MLRHVRHLAEYFVFRIIVCAIDILSVRQSVRLAVSLATFVHHGLPRRITRYAVCRENIRRAFGDDVPEAEVDRLVHAMWVHLFRLLVEIVQLPRKLRRADHLDCVVMPQRDETVRLLASGRPVIVLSGHFGNWELANHCFGVFGWRMGVVARDMDNPLLHRWFARYRQRTGHRLIPKKGGAGDIVRIVERRGYVGMLGDQDAGSKGLFVEFFGHDASTFKSIALLAMQHRALICVGYARRLPDDLANQRWPQFELGNTDVIDPEEYDGPQAIRQITQRYTTAIERAVRLAPEQYFWLHRRWKSKPGQRQARRKAA